MSTGRKGIWLLGAIAAALVAGCDGGPPAPGPAAAPEPPLAFTNEGRIDAMLSIHAFAFWPDGPPRGVELKTVSLPRAVALLRDDPDPFAVSRRRRAIARLAAYGIGRPEIDALLEQLGADLDALRRAFDRHGGILGPRPAFAQPAEKLGLGPDEEETIAYDLHANLSIPNCQTKKLLNWVGSSGAAATAASSVWVGRDVADVAKALDPQSWDQCSKFFSDTCLARRDAGGVIVEDPAEPLGAAWKTRTLYEHFVCAATGCGAWFENLLFVTTWYEGSPNQSKYVASYGFNSWLDGVAKITGDDGDLWARKDAAGGTIADSSKNIAFEKPGLTGMAEAALAHSEMAGELAELACCGVGGGSAGLPVVKAANLTCVQP